MDADARLEALQAENERLRDELEMLKDSLGLTFTAPLEWRLTASETKMFGRLLKGPGVVTKAQFLTTLYRDANRDPAEEKIVDVFVCKMRRKLRAFGLGIETIWGQGYMLSPETRAAYQKWAVAP